MRLPLPSAVDAVRVRDFRLLFAGQTLSNLGSALVPVALAFAVLDLTGSATDLGLVLLAARLPLALLVVFGGVLGDRLPRRWVMLGSDLVRCATQAATAALLLSGRARLWELLLLQGAHGAAAAFFDPAATGLVPRTVSPGRLQQANSLLGLSRSATAHRRPARRRRAGRHGRPRHRAGRRRGQLRRQRLVAGPAPSQWWDRRHPERPVPARPCRGVGRVPLLPLAVGQRGARRPAEPGGAGAVVRARPAGG